MKRLILLGILATMFLFPQKRTGEVEDPLMRRMPDGRTQAEHVLEHDHKKSRQDVKKLVAMAEELQVEIEKNDYHVLSLSAVKKAEEIEKLAKKIKNRLKRY
jgi:hypothetical protein